MKKPKNKNNTPVKPREKERFDDYYYDMVTLREVPISEVTIEKIARDFLKWAMENDDALKVLPFFRERGISYDNLGRWRKRSKYFASAYQMAKEAIGDRRECGAIKRKYSEKTILSSMARYDKGWEKLEKWRSSLKKQEQDEKTTTFNINIPNFKEKDNDGSGKDI